MFKSLTNTNKIEILIPWLMILLVITAESATDMYAPNLPEMVAFFGINESLGQLTISLNLMGLALSGLVYGPLSDIFGRKKIILAGMSIFCLGSWGSYLANDITELLLMRLIQGMGAGVSVAVGMAVIRDVFSNNKAAQVMSRLGMVIALSPGLAPMLGTIIAEWKGWQMVFLFVFLLGIATISLLGVFMPETLRNQSLQSFSLRGLAKGYVSLFSNGIYLRFTLIQALTIGWLWGEMGNLPFILVDGLGLSSQAFALHMFIAVVTYCIGALVNQKLVMKLGPLMLLRIGLYLVFLNGLILTIFSLCMPLDFWAFIAITIPGSLGLAAILPNAPSNAFEAIPHQAGAGAALMGSLQLLCGSLGTLLVGLFYNKTFQPIGVAVLIATVICLILLKGRR